MAAPPGAIPTYRVVGSIPTPVSAIKQTTTEKGRAKQVVTFNLPLGNPDTHYPHPFSSPRHQSSFSPSYPSTCPDNLRSPPAPASKATLGLLQVDHNPVQGARDVTAPRFTADRQEYPRLPFRNAAPQGSTLASNIPNRGTTADTTRRPPLGFADVQHPASRATNPARIDGILGMSRTHQNDPKQAFPSRTGLSRPPSRLDRQLPSQEHQTWPKGQQPLAEIDQQVLPSHTGLSRPVRAEIDHQALCTSRTGLSRPPSRIDRQLPVQEHQTWPTEQQLLADIQTALNWMPTQHTRPLFSFKYTAKAARFNAKVLAHFNWDLDKAITFDPKSPLHPGSEWRPRDMLHPILYWHPSWKSASQWMYEGTTYPLLPIPDEIRLQEITAALEYGNHKSSHTYSEFLVAELRKEITNGWQLPLTIEALLKVDEAFISPMGVQEQNKLNPDGSRTPSKRATHDLSTAATRDRSINARVEKEKLDPLVYGFAFLRFIHLIVTYRLRHPDAPLYLSKSDLKAAFRRLQTRGSLAVQSAISTKGLGPLDDQQLEDPIALCALRLTFGGAPNPALFCPMSEAAVDLAVAISSCPNWDPSQLASSHAATAQAAPRLVPPVVQFAEARELQVDVQAQAKGGADVFIDDLFAVCPGLPGTRPDHMAQAILLAIEVLCRTPSDADSMPRSDLLSLAKAVAEGTPSERLIVLGWLLDTRRLLVSLPYDKYVAWSSDVEQVLHATRPVPAKIWKALIGRLQNVAQIIRPASHFMSRLRYAETRAIENKATLPSHEERADLELWLDYLRRSSDGISLNLLTFRKPDVAHRGDASLYQLGGWNVNTGRAWRFCIPDNLQGHKSINFLEFLTSGIEFFLAIEEGELQTGDSFLSGTDNTTARGWMHKSNFQSDSEQHAHLDLARAIARASLENDIALDSQWWCGESNTIADILSRDREPSDTLLTTKILTDYPTQVPPSFKISPLPEKITSAICFWLQLEPPTTASQQGPTPKTTPHGDAGSNSYSRSGSWTIPTSSGATPNNATDSSAPSPKPSENAPGASRQKATNTLLPALASVPSVMWQRPSWQPADPTHGKTLTEQFANFFNI